MKVYLDIRLLGLYYCDSDLNVTTKRFHRSSHGRQEVCIRPLEVSHYRGNDTAQRRLRGELKTHQSLSPYRENEKVDMRLVFKN